MFLLDANVFIDAHRDYYPVERVPEYWEWVVHHGEQGNIKVPREIYHEITIGNGAMCDWAKDVDVKAALLLQEDADPQRVAQVIAQGYQLSEPTDDDVERIGRDPFLVAYALAGEGRTVVTTERSKPSRVGANRHVPDVCHAVGVACTDPFTLLRALDFSTGWQE